MWKRWWVIAGVALAATVLGGGWFLHRHVYPVPQELVGTWENETKLFDAGPGEVQLAISRRGLIDIRLDREKYEWWGPDQLHLCVSAGIAEVWSDPDRKGRVRVVVHDGRMTVSDPERPVRPDEVIVFRRVMVP
jgi:hypothetical protein